MRISLLGILVTSTDKSQNNDGFLNAEALKSRRIPFNTRPIDQVSNVIACASGKGGVGKSTTAVALAYTLRALGARVGILDCDIHGPNIGCLLQTSVDKKEHDILDPVVVDGIATQSIAYWVDEGTALAWRGPMVTKALLQMAYQTRWPKLDFLLLDLPPETGDIALSICKKTPLCAAFLVTTAQASALSDVARARCLFDKCKIPVLGVVENMSSLICESCGHVNSLITQDTVTDWAKLHKIQLLASIPFSMALHSGKNVGKTALQNELAEQYQLLAQQLTQALMALPRDYSKSFGSIQVNDDGGR